jgi:uncharacterized protein (TIGR02145 family)
MNQRRKNKNRWMNGGSVCFALILALVFACEKIEPERIVKISTEGISGIQYSSAVVQGSFIDMSEKGVTEHGHCWSIHENPTISDPHKMLGSRKDKGSFQSQLDELTPGTLYYVRAYAQTGDAVIYGENKSFSTLAAELPTVNTTEPHDILMNYGKCGGDVTADGGFPVTARGICWNTTGDPSLEDDHVEKGSGLGTYEVELTGLASRTKYYVKAWATNQVGTNLGNQVIFTTSDLPQVGITDIGTVKPNSIECFSNVTDNGGAEILSRGFCWDRDPDPGLSEANIEAGNGPGDFSKTIPELSAATQFFIRAYATNINGTTYGQEIVVTTPFTDSRNFKTYPVVKIGEQYWMAENLDYGTFINSSEDQTDNSVIEKYCYNNNEDNCALYGGYYTWSEMMQYVNTESAQGVCPSGWHVPSDVEWKMLEMNIGMSLESADSVGWRGTNEGGKLKAIGTELWESPNEGATNESGFNALPNGYFDVTEVVPNDKFKGVGSTATFWTTTSDEEFTRYYHHLDYSTAKIFRTTGYSGNGTPVRCVKD